MAEIITAVAPAPLVAVQSLALDRTAAAEAARKAADDTAEAAWNADPVATRQAAEPARMTRMEQNQLHILQEIKQLAIAMLIMAGQEGAPAVAEAAVLAGAWVPAGAALWLAPGGGVTLVSPVRFVGAMHARVGVPGSMPAAWFRASCGLRAGVALPFSLRRLPPSQH